MARFTRAAIANPLSGAAFPAELQGWLNYILNSINTLSDEAALDRLYTSGVGRIDGQSATLSNASGTLRMADGWMQAGAGVGSGDPAYFAGARLVQVLGAGGVGYIEITGSDAPPLSKPDGTHGYMSFYGDVIWFDAKQSTNPDGRWYIGEVVTDATGVTGTPDDDVADIVYKPGATSGGVVGGEGEFDPSGLIANDESLQSQIDNLALLIPTTGIADNNSNDLQTQSLTALSAQVKELLAPNIKDGVSATGPTVGYGQDNGDGTTSSDLRSGGNATIGADGYVS